MKRHAAWALAILVGCSSSEEGATPSEDDAGPSIDRDAGAPPGSDVDGGTNDAAVEGGLPEASIGCASDADACLFGARAGLCKGGACVACDDAVDDAACDKAYDTGKDPRICSGGACVHGDCRAHADCGGGGRLCGARTPGICGPCANDSACVLAFPHAPICNRATGRCVARADACVGRADGDPCSDWKDVCCAGACVPGECCAGAPTAVLACQTLHGNCSEHRCDPLAGGGGRCVSESVPDQCAAPNDDMYYADAPGANGCYVSGSSACPFRYDLTAALKAIGPNPPPGTKLVITGSRHYGAVVGTRFPLVVPPNLTITTTGGPVVFDVDAAAGTGVILTGAGSALIGAPGSPIVITGMGGSGSTGVVVASGASARLEHVVVDGFAGDGIFVETGGTATIGAGVDVGSNGTWFDPRAGLRVSGAATIDVAGGASTVFHDNAGHGILVDGAGSLTIHGGGAVVARANRYSGLWVEHTGAGAADITGFVSAENDGSGVGVTAGSHLVLRETQVVQNGGSGVLVAAHAAAARSTDLSRIDLGTAASSGRNVVQGNARAGLCLSVDPGAGTLSARGNVFAGKDCVASPAALTYSATSCATPLDLALEPAAPSTSTSGNVVDVASCTHP